MFKTFTLPLTSSYQSIWTLLQGSSFIDSRGNDLNHTDAIIVDRVQQLDVRPADASLALTVTYRDQFEDPGTEQQLLNMTKRSNRNSICLRDYLFAESTGAAFIVVEIEST